MIDLRELKKKIGSDEKLKQTALMDILQEQSDIITEDQYLTLVPILLKLSKSVEVLA